MKKIILIINSFLLFSSFAFATAFYSVPLPTSTSTLSGFELLINKSTDTNLGISDTLYPTQNAVKSYVDTSTAALDASKVNRAGDTMTGNLITPNLIATYGVSAATMTATNSIVVANVGTNGYIEVVNQTGSTTTYITSNGISYFNSGNVGFGIDYASTTMHLGGTYAEVPSATQILYSTNTISPNSAYIIIISSGGAVALTSNPQITTTNIADGTIIEIWGSSDTDIIQLVDGNGLKLQGDVNFTLGNDDCISFRYSSISGFWRERYRSNN